VWHVPSSVVKCRAVFDPAYSSNQGPGPVINLNLVILFPNFAISFFFWSRSHSWHFLVFGSSGTLSFFKWPSRAWTRLPQTSLSIPTSELLSRSFHLYRFQLELVVRSLLSHWDGCLSPGKSSFFSHAKHATRQPHFSLSCIISSVLIQRLFGFIRSRASVSSDPEGSIVSEKLSIRSLDIENKCVLLSHSGRLLNSS
jgi:hypothetical protein